MKHTTSGYFFLLILAMCLTAGTSWAKTIKSTTKTEKTGNEKTENRDDLSEDFDVAPDLDKLYAEIADVVRLDKQGRQKLLNLQKQKTKKLEEFENRYGRKTVELQNKLNHAKDDKQKIKIIMTLSKICSSREKLHRKYDTQAFRILRKDQIIAWNRHELWKIISRDLQFDGELEMTDDQVEKSKAICDQIANRAGAKMRIAMNPEKRKTTISQIGRVVLTKQQQKAYLQQQRIKRRREKANTKTITVVETRGGGCCHH